MATKQEIGAAYKQPKSVCACGHTGDGPGSQHEGYLARGHGACKVDGCGCVKFTWSAFTLAFQQKIAKATD